MRFFHTKRTSIVVPILPGDKEEMFRVSCPETGEIFECKDLAPLLRNIAKEQTYLLKYGGDPVPSRTYKVEVWKQ